MAEAAEARERAAAVLALVDADMARLAAMPDPRDLGHYARELAAIADGLAGSLAQARADYQALKRAVWDTPGKPGGDGPWDGMDEDATLRQAAERSLAFDRAERHREDAFRLRRALRDVIAACSLPDNGTKVRRLAEEALAAPEPS